MGSAVIKNNAVSRLASSLAPGATALSVTAGQGSIFPVITAGTGNWFPVTLINAAGVLELVRCTARTGDVLTVVRAQEGTAALSLAAGDRVELRLTAAVIEDINTRLAQTVIDLAATIASLGLTGAMCDFAQLEAPPGWLKANGAAVSRTAYAALFAVIGTTYGVGDGSTTFNLPDPRGLFVRVLDDGKGNDVSRVINTIQAPALLTHAHTASTDAQGFHGHSGVTYEAGNHIHPINRDASGGNGFQSVVPSNNNDQGQVNDANILNYAGNHQHALAIDGNGSHGHNIAVAATGGAENRPQNIAFPRFIKY